MKANLIGISALNSSPNCESVTLAHRNTGKPLLHIMASPRLSPTEPSYTFHGLAHPIVIDSSDELGIQTGADTLVSVHWELD